MQTIIVLKLLSCFLTMMGYSVLQVGAHDHERVDRLGLEFTALLADVISDF